MQEDGKPINDVLQNLLKQFKLKEPMARYDILGSWELIMGKVVAKHTLKLYIKKNCLYAHVDSSVLRNQLDMNKSKIIELVNEHARMKIIHEVVIL